MRAALTYASRYALCALVGIEGKDDLDAPDGLAVSRGAEPRAPFGAATNPAKGALSTVPRSYSRSDPLSSELIC